MVTDSTQGIVWSTTYQPYGTTPIPTGSITQNIRLPGQFVHGETGFYYNMTATTCPTSGDISNPTPSGLQLD
jgi:hypothetical protein